AAAARPAGGFRADYSFVATVDREIMRYPERKIGYGITDSWDEIVETLQGAPVSTDTKLGGYVREFEMRVRHDTDESYMRRAHAYTRQLMETEARMSREAWVRATDASDVVHGEVMSLRTTVLGQMRQTVILELLRIDHRRSTEISKLRTALQGQVTALQAMIDQGVTTALAARDALRSTNGDDSHNSETGCERMESVFHISNYTAKNQVKFATCTLYSVALTWWNTHVQTVGHEAVYSVKGTDLESYTQRYQELALLCGRMFSEEADKIEKYVEGLPDIIHGSVVASKPKTMQEAIEIATELMDKKIRTFA
nr:hypothetical protein [Tanacetum cinerariifolium]